MVHGLVVAAKYAGKIGTFLVIVSKFLSDVVVLKED
jgi:hypothetical protein